MTNLPITERMLTFHDNAGAPVRHQNVMRVKHFRLFVIPIIALGLAHLACDETCVDPAIRGQWLWTKTAFSGTGFITPESEKIERKLIIDEFIYREYADDTLVFESQYDIVLRPDTLSGLERQVIVFESNIEYDFNVVENELHLLDRAYIPFVTHSYQRF